MMPGRRYINSLMLAALVLVGSQTVCAQSIDTTRQLRDSLATLEVTGQSINPTAGTRLLEFSATNRQALAFRTPFAALPLSAWLTEESLAFVRSSGISNTATFTVRGASAAQSLVLWNGVPINNSALGFTDVSLISGAFIGEATLATGSSAALLGSGNVGGALLLDDAPARFGEPSAMGKASLSFGSFQNTSATANAAVSDSQDALRVILQSTSGVNDFAYTNAQGRAARMANSRQVSTQAMVSYATRRIRHTLLSLKVWATSADRQIPPALYESSSVKTQHDQAIRCMAISRSELSPRLAVVARAAFTSDALAYADPAIRLATNRVANRVLLHQEWTYRTGNHAVLAQVPVQYAFIGGRAGDSVAGIWQAAGALSYAYTRRALRATANVRYEKNGRWSGWMPGVGIRWGGDEQPHSLYASVQRTFRAPTLNELYFFPGGNPLLKPEQGWAAEAGGQWQHTRGRSGIELGSAVFGRYIRDWIIWYGGAIFTPHNIAAVYSRGIEGHAEVRRTAGPVLIRLRAEGTWLRSTTEESDLPGDAAIGRQIPYVPRLVWRTSGSLQWRVWALRYVHGYNGTRFVTTDESVWLLPYATASATLEKSWTYKQTRITAVGYIANLWNARYESVTGRPMPGRYVQAMVQVAWR